MHRRTFLKSMIATTTATFFGGTAYAYRSSSLEVSYERLALPTMKPRLRIIAVSDLHAPCSYSSAENLIDIINAARPDIFILAGDTIDKQGDEDLVGMFKAVKARFAKVATLGNWEYFAKLDLVKLKTEYNNAGISLLVNDISQVQGLTIVGLDDFVLGAPDYKILNHCSSSRCPVLVISHCPESFDHLPTLSHNPLIVLSGHTHGGQIAPFGLALITPQGSGSYVKGWYNRGQNSMYVMRGIGTSGIPLRIGARPELLVLDLVGAET